MINKSNDAENSDLITEINYILTDIYIENKYFEKYFTVFLASSVFLTTVRLMIHGVTFWAILPGNFFCIILFRILRLKPKTCKLSKLASIIGLIIVDWTYKNKW